MITLRVLAIIADVVGIFAGIFAFGAWWQSRKLRKETHREQERLQQPIRVTIKLSDGKSELQLPVHLRRGELSRAEVLGRIGMLPMKKTGDRFEILYFNSPDFFSELDRLQQSEGEDTLTIVCSKDEFDRFENPV